MIAQGLVKRGWEVSYISESPPGRRGTRQENGVRLYHLPTPPGDLSFLNYFALWRVMSRIKASVYYQRVVNSYTGLTVGLSDRQGASSVWASSSLIIDCYPNPTQRAWKSRPHHQWGAISRLPAWFTDRIVAYGIRNADQIVAQTQEQKDAIMHEWKREVMVIPNAHPVPPQVAEKTEPPVIVWLGSIMARKRPLMFVDLAGRCSDMSARFVMAGAPTEQALSAELNERARGVPNLSYLGPIPFEETNNLLQGATLLVNTSVGEGFSNTFVQAWLRGVPAVSFVDPDNVIQRNRLGACVTTVEDLVQSVRHLAANPVIIRALGKNCRDYAVRAHGLNRVMDLYDSLFTTLAERASI